MFFYRISGLTVASEIALPGARAAEEPQLPDVVMRRMTVPAKLDRPTVMDSHWEADATSFLFRAEGVGRFLLTGDGEIGFEPAEGAEPSDCAAYLLGSVFGIMLHRRGVIVLHASAVEVNGKAILFCGRSGFGKSTIAAALCLRGYPFLGDDMCAIVFDDQGRPCVNADSRQHKLSAEAIKSLKLANRRGLPVLHDIQKYHVEPPSSSHGHEIPIGAIYLLHVERRSSPMGIAKPTASEAVRRLQRHAYRLGIVERTGQSQRYFEAAVRIVEHVGVYRLARPGDLARLPKAVLEIEDHWLKNGLCGKSRNVHVHQF